MISYYQAISCKAMCNIVGLEIDKRDLPPKKSSSTSDEYHLEHVQIDLCLLWNLVGELQPPFKRLLLVPPANRLTIAQRQQPHE